MKEQKTKIRRGNILLAEPFMLDPNFKRSMVLVCDYHKQEGVVGFVLNKCLDIPVNDLIASFPEIENIIYFGGPVATDTVHYIHNVGDLIDGSHPVSDGVWWGGDFEQLKEQVKNGKITSKNIRFFVGYSGWDSGQLEGELKMGSWVVSNMKASYLFSEEAQSLWEKGMQDKGDTFSIISKLPNELHWS